MIDTKPPLVWIITEGLAGTENQCLGVAECLGAEPILKKIKLREPWKTLSPYLGFERAHSFDPTGDVLTPPWPDLVLASGRKSIAASRFVKRQNPKTFTVQIQDPRISPKYFDLVAVPEHDPSRGENVIVTSAAPNRVNPEKLASEAKKFSTQLQHLPSPRIAVLIGGKSKTHQLTSELVRKIAMDLKSLADQNYGLMITASRRTGPINQAKLRQALHHKNIFFWDGKGENPFFAYLALADFVIVTSDSTSMMAEAATAGKPIYLIDLKGGSRRHHYLIHNLTRKGITRSLPDVKSTPLQTWTYEPLRDAHLIADEIRRKSGLFN